MGKGRIWLALLAALLLFGLVAGVGVMAYNAGVMHGMLTASVTAPPTAEGAPSAAPFYAPYMFRPSFGFGFGWLWCLAPLFWVFFLFILLRLLFGRPRWHGGWGRMYGKAWDPTQGDIPPHLQALHRKLHEQEETPAA